MKKILFILISFLYAFSPAYAEKIPVKITPAQLISTHHDEIQVGDWIHFETVNDVYLDDKLYIKKDTKIVGVVDYAHENGWMADSADITIKNFKTLDVNDKKIDIYSPIEIKGGNFMETDARDTVTYATYVVTWLAFFVRGAEINIEPDTRTYNLFIEQ